MTRVAIVGSCISRDLWPFLGRAPSELLYVARTSLPSLFARPPGPIETAAVPPPPLKRHPHNALVADLTKTALAALVLHRPTHIIFDFIDERFDLLSAGPGLVNYSWELAVSGYLDQASLKEGQRIPRLSQGCDLLWRQGLADLSAFLALTPLREARIILHRSQWADRYRTSGGRTAHLDDTLEIMPGQMARRSDHNALLARYEADFLARFPGAELIAAPAKTLIADEGHQWGLSPFHYVPAYYEAVCEQLAPLLAGSNAPQTV